MCTTPGTTRKNPTQSACLYYCHGNKVSKCGIKWNSHFILKAVFVCAKVLSTCDFDADRFIDFASRVLIYGYKGLGTYILFLTSMNSGSAFMLSCWYYCVNFEFWNAPLELGCYFAGSMVSSDNTALRQLLLVKIRSVRMPGTIVRSWPLVWQLSLAPWMLD